MAAYATPQITLATERPRVRASAGVEQPPPLDLGAGTAALDAVIDLLAARVVERMAAVSGQSSVGEPGNHAEWFDSRHAANYLGIHRDTLRRLAAERAIPSEQDGPNCKLYFRRADLDAWRLSGGGPRHLAATLSHAV